MRLSVQPCVHTARTRLQRGAAALTVALVLLFAMTIVAFYSQRTLLFEQRSSANQYRSTRAFEAAEAGLEWALASLNDPRRIDTSCLPRPGGPQSFRDRYAVPTPAGGFAPATGLRPGCSLAPGRLVCSCPVSGVPMGLLPEVPSFTLEFTAVTGDPQSLKVVSRGCAGLDTACVPGSTEPGDATATAEVLLKLRPLLRAAPVAALTAGGDVQLDGSWQLANTDPSRGGYVIDAAGSVLRSPAVEVTGLSGTPPAYSIVANDAALARLASVDGSGAAWFAAFFGSSLDDVRAAPTMRVLGPCDAVDCPGALQAALDDGYRHFVVTGDLTIGTSAAAIGSVDRPMLLVATGQLRIDPTVAVTGLLYTHDSNSATGGIGDLRGAWIARGPVRSSSGGRLRYDAAVFARLQLNGGAFTRVPGSWRDGRCSSADPRLPCAMTP